MAARIEREQRGKAGSIARHGIAAGNRGRARTIRTQDPHIEDAIPLVGRGGQRRPAVVLPRPTPVFSTYAKFPFSVFSTRRMTGSEGGTEPAQAAASRITVAATGETQSKRRGEDMAANATELRP